MGVSRLTPPASHHLDAVLGCTSGCERNTPLRRHGPQGHPVHWGTAILRAAAAGRPALESTVGGGCRTGSTDQLPYRLGQYGDGVAAKQDRGLRQDGGVYRTVC